MDLLSLININNQNMFLYLSLHRTGEIGDSIEYDRFNHDYCNLLGVDRLTTNPFHTLKNEEFSICLKYLISIEKEQKKLSTKICLNKTIFVKEWTLNNLSVRTRSKLSISYGYYPLVGTEFVFNNESEFEYMNSLFTNIGICKLNKKHLKPIRNNILYYSIWSNI